MKKPLVILVLVLAACASSDRDEPPMGPRGRMPSRMPPPREASSDLDFVPLTDWWRQPAISAALNLSEDQYTRLDRIAADQRDEITRLERDVATAMRDLRGAFDATPVDVMPSAQRARELRDTLFDRKIRMLADERAVLTSDQWQALQRQLQEDRSGRRDDFGGRRNGGRRGGMGGGRGRWPGF